MIYLDNAATTGKKPDSVVRAVVNALTEYSVNPGRGSFPKTHKCAQKIFKTRTAIKKMFNCDDETQVVFTANCTESANFVLKGILQRGDSAVISSAEHNAVARPCFKLNNNGVQVEVAEIIFGDDDATVRSFERLIDDSTRIIVCTHASNVNGQIMPIEKLGKLCKSKGILFAVDAAQTAGIIPIDMKKCNIDFLFIAPHKGLYAPMGTGVLIARKPLINTLIEGGTGTESMNFNQPLDYPERLESGTLNVPGIFGISAGMDFVKKRGIDNIYSYEMMLCNRFYNQLNNLPGITFLSPKPEKYKTVPTLSFIIDDILSEQVAEFLAQNGIAVRAGLHCAPLIHSRLGSLQYGTVRVCFCVFNTVAEVDRTVFIIKKLLNKAKR